MSAIPTIDIGPLMAAAKAVIDAIAFDENGAMIGGKWMGGNGGLISTATLKHCDALRREIEALKAIGIAAP